MCDNCGCQSPESSAHHHHTHSTREKIISVNQAVQKQNNVYAEKNRELFRNRGIYCINLISSPGSGKTTLLQAMAQTHGQSMAVVVGDLQTQRDAERIKQSGCQAVQIETKDACHLDAHAVGHALQKLDLNDVTLVVIENVGNLVCPASYDLGEDQKVGMLSVTEGDDKIIKYPSLFSRIETLLINKIDLIPYVQFDLQKAKKEAALVQAYVDVIEVSAFKGIGIEGFYWHLLNKLKEKQGALEPVL